MMGININDDSRPFTFMILNGIKTVETRNGFHLDPYIDQRVGIVRTLRGRRATLVGHMTIGAPMIFHSEREFEAFMQVHRVDKLCKFWWKPGQTFKVGYPIYDPVPCDPKIIESRGIISRKI